MLNRDHLMKEKLEIDNYPDISGRADSQSVRGLAPYRLKTSGGIRSW